MPPTRATAPKVEYAKTTDGKVHLLIDNRPPCGVEGVEMIDARSVTVDALCKQCAAAAQPQRKMRGLNEPKTVSRLNVEYRSNRVPERRKVTKALKDQMELM